MCGIAGAVDLTRAEPITSAVMGSMLATLRHRGPDDEGTYFDDHIALARAASPSSISPAATSP